MLKIIFVLKQFQFHQEREVTKQSDLFTLILQTYLIKERAGRLAKP
jgi:hypothetical protein